MKSYCYLNYCNSDIWIILLEFNPALKYICIVFSLPVLNSCFERKLAENPGK